MREQEGLAQRLAGQATNLAFSFGQELEEAVKLRLEQPARSAAHIAEMLFARHGVRISERTLREQLQKRGLTRAELLRDQRTFGRYEAAVPNERWIADVLVGPWVPHPKAPGSQRARLFLIVDDHSRLLVHSHWVGNETLRAGQEVLHAAILRRGLPEQLHVDNGPAFAGHELRRTCDAAVTEELEARTRSIEAAMTRLEQLAVEDWTAEPGVNYMRMYYGKRRRHLDTQFGRLDHEYDEDGHQHEPGQDHVEAHQAHLAAARRLRRELLDAERASLLALRNAGAIGDEVLRRVQRDLDLEEVQLGEG